MSASSSCSTSSLDSSQSSDAASRAPHRTNEPNLSSGTSHLRKRILSSVPALLLELYKPAFEADETTICATRKDIDELSDKGSLSTISRNLRSIETCSLRRLGDSSRYDDLMERKRALRADFSQKLDVETIRFSTEIEELAQRHVKDAQSIEKRLTQEAKPSKNDYAYRQQLMSLLQL
ncbi:uncharacterized protein L969DRAFT_46642 [Mixia osmundae IAM 14324]|uniref:Uncharacterized protein n=1 Tax=Mixia osmundae (strain CBS 9802 / IAM 14324 / JCM 22182 / KY 12970) TaxID=764103 RepID=G7E5G8_MIXOS|nr:uncharacterized protein L969DRAFT_46642 [Mixia osmundae IAM 14324]KEI40771.1 hypothetical protein L969DRAFT_46642 [Mixia osmundae IAM 14324]GAA98078.1 hypothetical protein E5Q_04760 [Mixia osmundae IAM 14324]